MCSELKTTVLAVTAILACSCSVLENRTECPWFLTLNLSDPCNKICDSIAVNLRSDGGYSYSAFVGKDEYARGLCINVPRHEDVYVNVTEKSVGERYLSPGTAGLNIPVGQQCPQAFMYTAVCKNSGGDKTDTVRLRKNYCGVSMQFTAGDLNEYRMVVEGNVCGYSLTGEPLTGDFLYVPFVDNPSRCYFRLPRQVDSSLRLSISTREGQPRYFALGNYIEDSGYDWTSDDLDDILIDINYSATTIVIDINGWKVCEDIVVRI